MMFYFSEYIPNDLRRRSEDLRIIEELKGVRPARPNPALTNQIICALGLAELVEEDPPTFPRILDPRKN
jgi:hypothetical protein